MRECEEPHEEAVAGEGGEGAAGPEAQYMGYFPTFRRIGRGLLRRWPSIRHVGQKIAAVLVKAFLVIVILLAIVDVAGAVYLGCRVKEELRKIAASGGVVNYIDGIPPPVASDENAAPLYLKAIRLLEEGDGPHWERPDLRPRPDRYDVDFSDPAQLAAAAAMVRRDAKVLEALRQATAMPKCRFETNWEDVFSTLFPHYSKMRRLARFLRAAVVEAALRGDGTEALERARMGFAMSRHVAGERLLISQLVGYAIDSIMVRAVMGVVDQQLVREEAARALAEEVSKGDLRAPFEAALETERALGIWFFEQLRRGQRDLLELASSPDDYRRRRILRMICSPVARPLLYANELVYLRMMGETIEMARKPWREAGWETQRARAEKTLGWAPLAGILMPVFTRAAAKRDQTIAMRALMVTALAIEVYRQKRGHLPESLAALKAQVPWATTEDVFSGQALVYRRKDGGYLLYSIGPNLKDDGGEPMEWQKKSLGMAPARLAREPDAGDLVWLPQLWRSAPR